MIPKGQDSLTSVHATPHGNPEEIGEWDYQRAFFDNGRLKVVGRSEDGRINIEERRSGGTSA